MPGGNAHSSSVGIAGGAIYGDAESRLRFAFQVARPLSEQDPPAVMDCAGLLSSHFTALNAFRMTDEESVRFRQIAVLGVRSNVRGSAIARISACCSALASTAAIRSCQSWPPFYSCGQIASLKWRNCPLMHAHIICIDGLGSQPTDRALRRELPSAHSRLKPLLPGWYTG